MIGYGLIIFYKVVINDSFCFELVLEPFIRLGFANVSEEVHRMWVREFGLDEIEEILIKFEDIGEIGLWRVFPDTGYVVIQLGGIVWISFIFL